MPNRESDEILNAMRVSLCPLIRHEGELQAQHNDELTSEKLGCFLRNTLRMSVSSTDILLLLFDLASQNSFVDLDNALERLTENSLKIPCNEAYYFVLRFMLILTELGEHSGSDTVWLACSVANAQIMSRSANVLEPISRFTPHMFARIESVLSSIKISSISLTTIGAYISVVSSVLASQANCSSWPCDPTLTLTMLLDTLRGLRQCLTNNDMDTQHYTNLWQAFGDVLNELRSCMKTMPCQLIEEHKVEIVALLQYALSCHGRRSLTHMALAATNEFALTLRSCLGPYARPLLNACVAIAESRPPKFVLVHALSSVSELCITCPAAAKSLLARIIFCMQHALASASNNSESCDGGTFDVSVHLYNEVLCLSSTLLRSFDANTLCELETRTGWMSMIFDLVKKVSNDDSLLQRLMQESGVVGVLADFCAKFADNHPAVLAQYFAGRLFAKIIIDAALVSTCYEAKTTAAWTAVRLQTTLGAASGVV